MCTLNLGCSTVCVDWGFYQAGPELIPHQHTMCFPHCKDGSLTRCSSTPLLSPTPLIPQDGPESVSRAIEAIGGLHPDAGHPELLGQQDKCALQVRVWEAAGLSPV